MINVTMTNEQKVKINVTPVTATGKPALLDGAPIWQLVSGPGTIDVAPDGLSGFVVSQDVIDPNPLNNVTVVNITADADLGAGIQNIADSVQATVIGALAANLGLAAEAPIAK